MVEMDNEPTILEQTANALVAKAEAVREATKREPIDVCELLGLAVEFADLLEKISNFALTGCVRPSSLFGAE